MSDHVYSDFDSTLDLDQSGNVILKKDRDAVIQSIRHIFATVSGERVRSPIGSSLVALLFKPITKDTASAIHNQINQDISIYEPRVTITELKVTPEPDKNFFEVRILFRIRNLQRIFSFETRLRSFA